MRTKIYQLAKTPTQSGIKQNYWIVEPLIEDNYRLTENLMGWTSSKNTLSQLNLKFNNQEDAIKYAKKRGWKFEVTQPKHKNITKKSYSDNFLNS